MASPEHQPALSHTASPTQRHHADQPASSSTATNAPASSSTTKDESASFSTTKDEPASSSTHTTIPQSSATVQFNEVATSEPPEIPHNSSQGIQILPIPPRLDFPYPRRSSETLLASESPADNIPVEAPPPSSPSSQPHNPSSPSSQPSPSRPTPQLSSSHSSQPHSTLSPASRLRPLSADNRRDTSPTTPGLLHTLDQQPQRPPTLTRAHQSERLPLRQLPSVLQIRRRQTGDPGHPCILDDSSSDSDSLSDVAPAESKKFNWRHFRRSERPPFSDVGVQKTPSRSERHKQEKRQNRHDRLLRRDGRLQINLGDRGQLAKALGTRLRPHNDRERFKGFNDTQTSIASSRSSKSPLPRLNIVIMVIGSRGDIQPFLRLAQVLVQQYHHRVRIATHPAFRDFIEREPGIEFFSVGGDPAELMAFMVKNPGLVPKPETIRAGEIGRRRAAMYKMFQGFWRACINASDDETDMANLEMMGDRDPFVANAIIANPPSFAHIHCAERLGVPLHLMFTFPTSPTQQFPHPLASIKHSNANANYTNFMSYPLVDMMTWQGLGDLVNRFRVKTLGLEPIFKLWAPGQLYRLKVPYTYMWSSDLIPKPADWGPEISVTGFVFLDLAKDFTPSEELASFLEAGPPPIYIGFGSIVIDDPARFTALVFEAVRMTGVRALISQGWGGIGAGTHLPDNIFLLGNTPHDWLFPRVQAVVHHGGAGSTAIGLRCGKPTMIVPFFGDQPFWGAMVAKAGAGAEPIPYKHLTAAKLADSIRVLLDPSTQESAKQLAQRIGKEGDGAENAVSSFHQHLALSGNHSMRCSIFPDRVAVWWYRRTHFRFSALAADILVQRRRMQWTDLRLIRHMEWNDFAGPGEPLTGGSAALLHSVTEVATALGRTPVRWTHTVKDRHHRHHSKATKSKVDAQADQAKKEAGIEEAPASEQDQVPRVNTTTTQNVRRHANKAEDDSEGGDQLIEDLALETGSSLAKAGRGILKAPIEFTMAVAQGLHNAPRLYGDTLVRAPPRVDGIHSGLRAAGTQLGHGIYDGWTGLVRQPRLGLQEEGGVGLLKGTGKGVGGFVLKNLAAGCAVPAYALHGLHKQLVRGRQPTRLIRRAQLVQGQKDYATLDAEHRKQAEAVVDEAWQTIKDLLREIRIAREKGVRGRWLIYQSKKEWRAHDAFESVDSAAQALAAARDQARTAGSMAAPAG